MGRMSLCAVSFALATLLASCHDLGNDLIVLRHSTRTGPEAIEEWNRFSKIVEAHALNAQLIASNSEIAHGCKVWRSENKSLVIVACPQHDDKGTLRDTAVLVQFKASWWNALFSSRADAIRSHLADALRAEFGDRIEARL